MWTWQKLKIITKTKIAWWCQSRKSSGHLRIRVTRVRRRLITCIRVSNKTTRISDTPWGKMSWKEHSSFRIKIDNILLEDGFPILLWDKNSSSLYLFLNQGITLITTTIQPLNKNRGRMNTWKKSLILRKVLKSLLKSRVNNKDTQPQIVPQKTMMRLLKQLRAFIPHTVKVKSNKLKNLTKDGTTRPPRYHLQTTVTKQPWRGIWM